MASTMPSRALVQASVADPVRLNAEHFELVACRKSGAWYLRDTGTGELFAGGRPMGEPVSVEAKGQSLRIQFKEPKAALAFQALPSGRDLDLSVEERGHPVLRDALWLAADQPGSFVVPQGEGWLVRAGQKVKHRFLTHQSRSHLTMQMFGVVRGEAALLLSWNDVGGCVDL
ncbi:MAG: hypothetical protein FJ290_16955, partial [Planctomycetes bacterium]|nr:hypothetical protein [Planctomycetota bacterium]